MAFSTSFFAAVNAISITEDGQRTDFSNLEPLVKSLRDRGLIHPIVIDKNNHVVVGRRRFLAAQQLGWEKIEARLYEGISAVEREAIELEENIKRKQLSWDEECRAVDRIHTIMSNDIPDWTVEKTAEYIGLDPSYVYKTLKIVVELTKPKSAVKAATNITEALTQIRKQQRREDDEILRAILTNDAPTSPISNEIICADFTQWAPSYSGPLFTVVHCDFPYGIDFQNFGKVNRDDKYEDSFAIYETLIDTLLGYWDQFASPVSHLIFWFSMRHYEYTYNRLTEKFFVEEYPLIWMKDAGIQPDPARRPQRNYETAFLCSYGDAKLRQAKRNIIQGPAMTTSRTHPSQKNQTVLEHFLSMVVDENTYFLDPTCGSGSSVRAAKFLGANTVLGLEIDPTFAEQAAKDLCE